MGIHIERQCFSGLAGALDDISRRGLWPTTYATDHATGAEPHWHTEDVHAYVIDGELDFLDGEGGRHSIEPGDKITIPARTVHAEGEITDPVVLIVALPEPLSQDRFLKQHAPGAL